MKKCLAWLLHEESGQSMVEYGLVIMLVALVAMVGLAGIATPLTAIFNRLVAALV